MLCNSQVISKNKKNINFTSQEQISHIEYRLPYCQYDSDLNHNFSLLLSSSGFRFTLQVTFTLYLTSKSASYKKGS